MNERDQQSRAPLDETQREAMLDDLIARMKRLHRARRARKTALASACLFLFMVVLTLPAVTTRGRRSERPIVSEPPPRAPAVEVRIVRTDPAVLDRYAAEGGSRVIILDDEALLEALALIDRPAGLIRMGDRAWLTADVVGAEREHRRPPKPPSS